MKTPSTTLRKLFLSCLLMAAVSSSGSINAQNVQSDNSMTSVANVQGAPSTMSLTQFQSVLRTFVDDELAFVVDSSEVDAATVSHHEQRSSSSTAGISSNGDDQTDEQSTAATDAVQVELDLETILKNRISTVEVDANGVNRRILKNFHHRHHQKHKEEDRQQSNHLRGRFNNVSPESIPAQVNQTWNEIVSHAWDMADLASTRRGKRTDDGYTDVKNRDLKKDKGKRSRGFSNDEEVTVLDEDSVDITVDGEEELTTEWTGESDVLFLVCHSSTENMSGNDHLKEILVASGKDVKIPTSSSDDTTDYHMEVVHSHPRLTCVILGMQPSYAWGIANKPTSSITLVPWVDVMKISPELFDHILDINDDSVVQEETTEEGTRGLRNFRRAQEEDDAEESLFWDDETAPVANELENKYVVFSMVSPSLQQDAQAVIADLTAMSKNGQRKRALGIDQVVEEEGNDESHISKLRKLSIHDAFSITQSDVFSVSSTTSAGHWSRLFSRGLESADGCVSMVEGITIESSFVKSSYEFQLVTSNSQSNSTTLSWDPACVASLVAGLAVHPSVVNVGIVSKFVQLDNAKAQWVVQGGATNSDASAWRRPYFDAGLDGSGQIVRCVMSVPAATTISNLLNSLLTIIQQCV